MSVTLTTPVRLLLAGVPTTAALGGTDVGAAPPGPASSCSLPPAVAPAPIQTLSCPIAQLSVSGGGGGLPTAAPHGESSDNAGANRPPSSGKPEGGWRGFYSAQCERDPRCCKGFKHGGKPGRCKLRGAPGPAAYDGTEDIHGLALGMAVQGWLVPIGARDSPQMHLSDHFSNLAKPPAKQTPARQPTQKAFITDWVPPPPSTGRGGDGAQQSLPAGAEIGRDEASCSASCLAAAPKLRKVDRQIDRYVSPPPPLLSPFTPPPPSPPPSLVWTSCSLLPAGSL